MCDVVFTRANWERGASGAKKDDSELTFPEFLAALVRLAYAKYAPGNAAAVVHTSGWQLRALLQGDLGPTVHTLSTDTLRPAFASLEIQSLLSHTRSALQAIFEQYRCKHEKRQRLITAKRAECSISVHSTMSLSAWLQLWRDVNTQSWLKLSDRELCRILRSSQHTIAAGRNLGWVEDSELSFSEWSEAMFRVACTQAPACTATAFADALSAMLPVILRCWINCYATDQQEAVQARVHVCRSALLQLQS